MAQEDRHINALDVNNGVTWSNQSNAYVEDDNYAETGSDEFGIVGEYCGGNYQDSQGTPTSLDLFQVRFMDISSDHANDTFLLQIYNPDTTAWETLETFDSGNLLPAGSLTTKTYTTAMQSKFNAASDKNGFLDGLQLRFYMSAKSAGADKPEIGLAWSKFTYTYTAGQTYYQSADATALVVPGESNISTRYRTYAATAVGVAAEIHISTIYEILAATAIGTAVATTISTRYRTLAATAIGVPLSLMVTTYIRAFDAVAAGVAAATAIPTYVRNFDATAIGIAVESRIRSLYRTLAATATGVGVLSKKMFFTAAATAIGVAVETRAKLFTQAADAIAAGIATATQVPTYVRSLTATALGIASESRLSTRYRTIAATALGNAAMTKKMYFVAVGIAVGVANEIRAEIYSQIASAVAAGIGVVATISTRYRTIAATAIGIGALTKKISKNIIATAVGLATSSRVGTIASDIVISTIATSSRLLKPDNIVAQLLAPLNTKNIFLLQKTSETGGNISRGIPSKKILKRHRLQARLSKRIDKRFIATGLALSGDFQIVTGEKLTMTDQVEHNNIVYDLIHEFTLPAMFGTFYKYLIRRTQAIDSSPEPTQTLSSKSQQALVSQMLSMADTGPVYELRMTGTSNESVVRGIPSKKVRKRRKLENSNILKYVDEDWIITGLAQSGDVKLITAKPLKLTSRIEHDSVTYDIVSEMEAPSHIGKYYQYILRRRQ